MNQYEVNLTVALYYEHKGRTGHDVFAPARAVDCHVCLYLQPLMMAAEAAQSPPEPEDGP